MGEVGVVVVGGGGERKNGVLSLSVFLLVTAFSSKKSLTLDEQSQCFQIIMEWKRFETVHQRSFYGTLYW